MATETLEFTLEVNGIQQTITSVEELQGAIKSLQTQISSGNYGTDKLKQLQTELDKATQKLQEMENAAKKSGEKTKEGADVARKGLGTLRESFDAAATAAELFGGENEKLGKLTQQVMKAIGIANSIREVSENKVTLALIKKRVAETAASVATKAATAVQWLWNAALTANPIGLIVAGIAALGIAILAITKKFQFLLGPIKAVGDALSWLGNKLGAIFGSIADSFDSAADIAERNAEKMVSALEDVGSAGNILIGNMKRQLSYMEASGASEEALLAKKKEIAMAEIKMRQDALNALIKISEAGGELSDEQKKKIIELKIAIADSQQEIINMEAAYNKKQADERKKASDDARKKSDDASKAAKQKRDEERKRIEEENKNAGAKLLAIQQENILASLKNEEDRAIKALEFADEAARREIEAMRAKGVAVETINALYVEQQKKYEAELTKIQEDGLKKREDQRKAYDAQLLDLQNQYALLTIENEQERANKELEIAQQSAITAIQNAQYTEEQKQELILQTQAIYKQKQADLDEEFANQQKEKDYARFQESLQIGDEFNMMKLSQQQALFDKQKADYEALIAQEAVGSERRKQLEKDYADFVDSTANTIAQNRAAALDAVQGAIQNVASLVGENTKAGKALAIADAVINTYKGASQALGSAPPPFNFVLAATVVAAGLANVKKIVSTKVDKGATSGGGSAAAAPGPSKFARGGLLVGPSHASGGIKTNFGELEGGEYVINRRSTSMYSGVISAINQIGGGRKYADGGMVGMETMAQLNDLEKKLSAPPPMKTYVVATDVTSAQNADFKINNLSRL